MEMEEYATMRATMEAKIFNKLIKSLTSSTTWPFSEDQTPLVLREVFEHHRSYISPVEVLESIIKNIHHIQSEPGLIIPFDPFKIARNFFGTTPSIINLKNITAFVNFFCYPWKTENFPYIYIIDLMLFKRNPELLKKFDFVFKMDIITWRSEFDLFFRRPKYACQAYQVFKSNLKRLEEFSSYAIFEAYFLCRTVLRIYCDSSMLIY